MLSSSSQFINVLLPPLHFTSEETEAQHDLFNLQQIYQEITRGSRNETLVKVQREIKAPFPKVLKSHPFLTKARVFISKQFLEMKIGTTGNTTLDHTLGCCSQ